MHLLPTKALTLHRPWAGLIMHHGKVVENRGWPPPRTPMRIAVHAGRTVDTAATDQLSSNGEITLPKHLLTEGLVGTVLVRGAHQATSCPGDPGCERWGVSTGWHWELTDPRPLPTPVPARGRQKLWTLTPDQIRSLQQGVPE